MFCLGFIFSFICCFRIKRELEGSSGRRASTSSGVHLFLWYSRIVFVLGRGRGGACFLPGRPAPTGPPVGEWVRARPQFDSKSLYRVKKILRAAYVLFIMK